MSGLNGSLTLQNNGSDTLAISSSGAFAFHSGLAAGSAYSVSVSAQPTGQSCAVANGSGTVGSANVASVTVTCTSNSFSVGGTISGLSQAGLVLVNAGDSLTLSANSTSFAFPADSAFGSAYSVTVQSQPVGAVCNVTNGAGTVGNGNVNTVQVTCAAASLQGTAAQQVVDASTGGTITVTDPSSPIRGTTVLIPPGALGDAQDTITIAYSTSLPGPLSSDATASGIIPVGNVITLSHSGTTPLQQAITVTVPYSVAATGPADFPVMLYWEPHLQAYQAVQVAGIDQANGLVTFVTMHWDAFVPLALPGLTAMVSMSPAQGRSAVKAGARVSAKAAASLPPTIDTGFLPGTDGFEILNFSTAFPATDASGKPTTLGGRGVCFGVVSFAAWYYGAKSSTAPFLYDLYATPSDDSMVKHIPQEDAMARELLARTYQDTIRRSAPHVQPDLFTLAELIVSMTTHKSPQLLYLNDLAASPNLNDPGNGAHSIVVSSYTVTDSEFSFTVYDSNNPYQPGGAWQPSPNLVFDRTSLSFEAWQQYKAVLFDAYGTYYAWDDLASLLTSTLSGGPPKDSHGSNWLFNTLLVQSSEGYTAASYPGGSSGPAFFADPVNGSSLTFNWSCPTCTPGSYYLHVYENNQEIGTPATQSFTLGAGGQCQGCSITVTTKAFAPASTAELVAFVDTQPNLASPGGQENIYLGYAGFQRGVLNGTPRGLARGINSAGTIVGGSCPQGYAFPGNEGPCFDLGGGTTAFTASTGYATQGGKTDSLGNLAGLSPCGFDATQSVIAVAVSEAGSILVEGGQPSAGYNDEMRLSCELKVLTPVNGVPQLDPEPLTMLALGVNSAGTIVGATCPAGYGFPASEGPCFNLSQNAANAFSASSAVAMIGGQSYPLSTVADLTPCGFDPTQSLVAVAVSDAGAILVEGGIQTSGYNDEARISCLLTPMSPGNTPPRFVASAEPILALGINSAGTVVGAACPVGYAFPGNEGPCFNLNQNGNAGFSASEAVAVMGGQSYLLKSIADLAPCGFDATQSTVAVAVSETGSILIEGGKPTGGSNDEKRISCLLTPAAPRNGMPAFDALPL